MNNWTLKGKRVLITGATKGIGLAAAQEMLALGAELCINSRSQEDIDRLIEELQTDEQQVTGFAADLSDQKDRERLHQTVSNYWNGLDVLVNNVGMNIRKPFEAYSPEEYRRIFETNLFSALVLTQQLFPQLKKGNKASVINVASVAGMVDVRSGAIYGMTKAAMLQMTRHLAVEWAPHGIRVNAVSPWYTRTPLAEPVLQQPERLELILQRTPLHRIAEAEEVAAAIAFLAMDKASYITGQNLVTDGGMTVSGL
jgi:NAD(P)-dependent dehydrogenase (short-subunit alcohol dehydrogenase family)